MLISRIDTLVIPNPLSIHSLVVLPRYKHHKHCSLSCDRMCACPADTCATFDDAGQKSPPRSLASQVRLLVRRVALIVVIHIGESFTLIR
jgi:hypothetical protein